MFAWKWAYVESDGTERGWFTDEGKKVLDRSEDGKQLHTWRRLEEQEVASMKASLSKLAYEQS